MKLAFTLGKTRGELLSMMSHYELLHWVAFSELHPLPHPWLETGQICAVAASPYRQKGKPPFVPTDFMPKIISSLPPKEQSATELLALLRSSIKKQKKGKKKPKSK